MIELNQFEEHEAAILLTAIEDYVHGDRASKEGKDLMNHRIHELREKLCIDCTIVLTCIECGDECKVNERDITGADWTCDCGGDMVRAI